MKGYEFLVDDRLIKEVPIESLISIGASGVSMSQNSSSQDEQTDKINIANSIAYSFELEEIIEQTKRIKKYRA